MLKEGAAARVRQENEPEVVVWNCRANEARMTYDGIDCCADRLVKELKNEVDVLESQGKTVTKVSLVGYSLGGCICRHAVGQLEAEGFFNSVGEGGSGIEAGFFTSIASPNLGSFKYPSDGILHKDSHYWGRPLLVNMADPNLCFHKGLSCFKKLVLMSNIQDDRSVKYPSVLVPFEVGRDSAGGEGKAQGQSLDCKRSDAGRSGSWMIVPFILLLPILLPLAIIMIVVESIRGLWHFRGSSDKVPDLSWLQQAHPHALVDETPTIGSPVGHAKSRGSIDFMESSVGKGATDYHPVKHSEDIEVVVNEAKVLVHEGIVTNSAEMQTRQEYMVTSLNSLPWIRVDVDCFHRHAHAAVVLRKPSRFTRQDHLEFLIERVLEIGTFPAKPA
eukprot:gene13448-19306_t